MRFAVDRLDHLVVNCRDVEITAAWYQRVLGMEREAFGSPPRTALKFGGQKLNLRPHDAPISEWLTAAAPHAGAQDLCFVVATPVGEAVRHLQASGVAVELGPIERQGALGPMSSIYCRDPDGNLIEISSYSEA